MTAGKGKKETVMNRRQWLITTAKAMGLAVGTGIWGYYFYSPEPIRRRDERIYTFKDFRVENSPMYPRIVIAHGKDVSGMVGVALEKLGGVSRFIDPGDRVLVKPNVGWDRQPELAANTNPDVVHAVVRMCLEARASEVWVTDVSINDPYRSFARSGIEAAVQKAGGEVKFTTEKDFVPTDLGGEILKTWPVSRFYHEVDKLINIPVVKHHSLSRCTIAMKNWYGVLGGRRNRLHQDINLSIADLATAIRPTLTIVDATRVLKKNGPTGGNLSDVSLEDTIIAGLDEVALDSFCLRYLDIKPEQVPFLSIAEKRGTGVSDWRSLNHTTISVG
jgi:uncharacterized protein (DUF362 family)